MSFPFRASFDLETWLFMPGNLAPPGVCGSWATRGLDGAHAEIASFPEAADQFVSLVENGAQIIGANFAYDACVLGAHAPHTLPAVFKAYERGQIFDVLIAQALDAIARGCHMKDPISKGTLFGAPGVDGKRGKVAKRYSLELVTYLVTGRANAKENAIYRLRYGELDGTPIAEWPEAARQYPLDDAINTLEVGEIQQRDHMNLGPIARWIPSDPQRSTFMPITHMTLQARAAFAMRLASTWGLRTDPEAVEALAARVEIEHAKAIVTYQESGILKPDGKENGNEIRRRVAVAYGSDPFSKCPACKGSCKVPSPKTGNPINCKTCGATGIEIAPSVPVTEGGGISTSRDTLDESNDPILEAYSDATGPEKIRETYVPFLRRGTKHPINIEPNVLVETARASYEGLLQTAPREGGVRECVIPRKGFVFCSVDYSALEFATLGQVCLWVLGYSRIAEAINSGKDAHSTLGARMIGIDYDLFFSRRKEKTIAAVRQGAKAGNFGFGGLMGPAKFALTQRKAKIGKHGSMCRLMHREAHPCGSVKITEWKRRPVPPVCDQCVEVSNELREGWFETWEETRPYFKWVTGLEGVKDGDGLIVSPGTGYVRSGMNASAAANHSFQHLAAMGAKHALWNVARECYTVRESPLYGSRPVLFAHDEIFAELPEDRAHEAGWRMAEVMIASMREFVPDVKISAEPAIMRRWYKGAETVTDSSGRLICWEPKP